MDQSWAFDAMLAFLVDHAGWPVVQVLTAVLLAGIYAALATALMRDGISPAVAVAVAIVTASAGAHHS